MSHVFADMGHFGPLSMLTKNKGNIHGIVLVPNRESLLTAEELEDIYGVESFGLDIPVNEKKLTSILGPIAFGRPFSYAIAQKVKEAISKYYYDCNDPFVLVSIPSQHKRTGVLQIIVMPARVGKVKVEGNQYLTEEKVRKKIPVKTGDRVNLHELDRSLYLINRNPFRRVDLIYTPGKDTGQTDLTMVVQDRRPYRFYGGFNNTGVSTTDRQRWFAGVTATEPYLDQIFSFQYMAAYKIRHFQAFTFQYILPFYWGHQLTVYGGYSEVGTSMAFPSTRSNGKSYQGSFRYNVPFSISQGTVREIYFGFDFKGTNNTLEFSQLFSNIATTVNLTQWIFGFNQMIERATYRVDLGLEVNYSPGKWISNQSNSQYEALRPGAKNHWLLGRGSLKYKQDLPKEFEFLFHTRAQIASQNLLPSEQIGLGGYDTVRGYTERQLNYDGGVLATVEGHSPKFPLVSAIRHKEVNDSIHFIAFMDYGWGANHNTLPGEPNDDYLLGMGPGIRYSLPPYVSASLDWGFKLHQRAAYIGGGSMLYLNVLLSY